MPASSIAFDRAGEIAFLDRDYERAAELFAKAARLAREQSGTWSAAEAAALLKRGTGLELAGRYAEALAVLAESDEVASRVHGLMRTPRAAYLSYSARLQMGDTYLRQHRYEAAVEQYAAARERERDLKEVRAGAAGRRPEVLDNNQALVEMRLGRSRCGAAAGRALTADPLSPIFLQTRGLALDRRGIPAVPWPPIGPPRTRAVHRVERPRRRARGPGRSGGGGRRVQRAVGVGPESRSAGSTSPSRSSGSGWSTPWPQRAHTDEPSAQIPISAAGSARS